MKRKRSAKKECDISKISGAGMPEVMSDFHKKGVIE